MYKGENWISYDNEKSIAIKVRHKYLVIYNGIKSNEDKVNQEMSFMFITQARYAFNQGLAGLMIFPVDWDDFLPECSNVRYPLLRAIHSEFNAASNDKQGDKMRTAGSSVVLSLFCNAIIFQFTENNFIILNRNQQRASV